MYRIDWAEVAQSGVLKDIKARTQADIADKELLPPLITILTATGGLPVATSDWSDDEKRFVARRLLSEAIAGMLVRSYGFSRRVPGCDIDKDDDDRLDRLIVGHRRVSVNAADAQALADLPVIGPKLAARVIKSRHESGYFATAEDLMTRVSGIGPSGAERLELMLDYETHRNPVGEATGDLDRDLDSILRFSAAETIEKRLLEALDAVASFAAHRPHPATLSHRPRVELVGSSKVPKRVATKEIEILEDEAYYERVAEVLASAKERIDVAMFFAAMPFKGHPTFKLIDLLCDAHDKGRTVRVLLDRDREEDPYNSTVINANAISYLKQRGVAVRVDAPDRLLHSKTIAVDNAISVIGSHNWTAGSYFKYRDQSVAITSTELTKSLHTRFDSLWDAAEQA